MKLLTEYLERQFSVRSWQPRTRTLHSKPAPRPGAGVSQSRYKTRWGPRDAVSESEGKVGPASTRVGHQVAAAGQGGHAPIIALTGLQV